jgi:uncharacterized protein (TIGR03083 family)
MDRRDRQAEDDIMTTTTALPRPYVATGALKEYEAFAALVASLTDADWRTPSRCTGFEVRDVAGHVIGLAEDVAAGKPGSRNAEAEAASVRGDTPAQAAARLRAALVPITALAEAADDDMWNGPSGVPDLTLGEGVLTLWYDAYVHADDIRAAIGRASGRGDGLHASVVYLAAELTKRGWGPATLALDTEPRQDIGAGGREVTGDPLQFVLVATGRADASTIDLEPTVNIYAD